MANPQPTDAHLRLAHKIGEQLMVSSFTEQQRRILDLILRLSWGCGKKEAYIPKQRDFEVIGVKEGHVKAHLDWLIEARVIERDGSIYAFNKDFDQWRVSRALKYSAGKLTELVSLNLPKTSVKRKKVLPKNGSSLDTKPDMAKERLKKDTNVVNGIVKSDGRVKEVFTLLEKAVGYKLTISFGKEGEAIKRILAGGYSPEQIVNCWLQMKKENDWWQRKWLPFTKVAEDIGEILKPRQGIEHSVRG